MARPRPIARGWRWLAATLVLWCAVATHAEAGCAVSTISGVSFGVYDVFSPTALDSTGRFSYRCDWGHIYDLRITITRGSSSTYDNRTMTSGGDALLYNLYTDSGRTTVWGDETEGTSAYYDYDFGLFRTNVTVYARIPAGQDVGAGTYSDTVTIVLNF